MQTTRLTDFAFFTDCVDSSIPALSGLPALARQGDFAAAQKIFADYVRSQLNPGLYLSGRREELTAERDKVIEKADSVLGHTFISCRVPHTFGPDIDWEHNPTYNGYEEWPWQLNRHPEWKYLAQGYLLTGDEKYAREWAAQLVSWARQAQVPENASGYATICWRTIEAGIRMACWAYVIHAFLHSPSVSDEIITVFFKSIWEHGWRLRNFCTARNWLIMEMHGLARIGLLFPYFRESAEWLGYAHARLQEELEIQLYPDGMQNELSMGYHYVVTMNYEGVLEMYSRTGRPAPGYLTEGLLKMYEHYVRCAAPDLCCPTMNDGGRSKAWNSLKLALKLFPEREDYRYIVSRRREGREPACLSLFHEYGGAAIMRQSWSEDALWAYMDCSPFGTAHQHEDKLNVQIFAYGREMLTEAGQFDYDSSEMRRYVLSTRGHNTARIDGFDQNRRDRYEWNPADISKKADALWSSDERRDVAEAVYTEGYGPDFLSVTHKRRFIFLKNEPNLPPMFLCIDRFEAADGKQHSYELMWHLNDHPTTMDGGRVVNTSSDGAGFAVVPSAGGISLVRGQKTPVYQGWLPKYGVGDVEHYPIPTVLNTGLFTAAVRVVTALCPFREGMPCVASVEASPEIGERSVTLRLTDGTSVTVEE